MKKRVLVVCPTLDGGGGGHTVVAWTLQALKDVHAVSLLTRTPAEFGVVNRLYGTSLRPEDFDLHIADNRWLRFAVALPTPGAFMELCGRMRVARELDARDPFDVLLAIQNEVDLGRRAIQYVHYPWLAFPRPDAEMRWFHRVPGLLPAYRFFCMRIAGGVSTRQIAANLTLANSEFTAGHYRKFYNAEARILHPPVPGGFPDTPWEQRRDAVVAIGRMDPCKRLELALDVVSRLRERGRPIELTIIASSNHREYESQIRRAIASRAPWARLLPNVSRSELCQEVSAHRYGIHAMVDEHFGIAPAEMLQAGCIPLVHNSGGPREIVGRDPRLLFEDAADAVEKLERLLDDDAEREDVRTRLAERRNNFTAARFMERMREVVANFEG